MIALATTRNRIADVIIASALAVVSVSLALATADGVFAQPGGGSANSAVPILQYNGTQIFLPTGKFPASRQSGLTLRVDPRWTNGYGYQPVKMTFSSAQPVKSARSIRIRLHVGWNRNLSVEQDFELPAGSTSASTTISLPIYQTSGNYFWWEIWVDDVRDKDLSLDQVSSLSWAGGTGISSSGLTFLVIGPPAKSRTLVVTSSTRVQVLSLEQGELPANWIDYTSFDVVSLSLNEAETLAKNRPAVFAAVLQWVRTGGQLWICDVGQEWEHLPAASRLVGLPESLYPAADELRSNGDQDQSAENTNAAADDSTSGDTDSNAATDADGKDKSEHSSELGSAQIGWNATAHEEVVEVVKPRQEGWRPLRFLRPRSDGQVITFMDMRTGQRRTVRDPDEIAQLQGDANYVTTNQRFEPDVGSRMRRIPGDSGRWFVQQPLGFGIVRAFRGANEADQFARMPPLANANAAANADSTGELPQAFTMGTRRVPRWETRHGLTPDSANVEFARLLVPGVGLAPVTEFRVLITIFVLLIGPINYWLLKRAKRLQLMVLTVPLAALVTTTALFAYAIVADGFETRVRAHSFTKLDQRTGDATCWTRLSYYSGLAPGNGLTLPADVALYPVFPSWAGDGDLSQKREIMHSGDELRLTRGWLNSRTPTQYLSIRARKSPHQLEVLDSGDRLRVKNHLGTAISYVALINAAGEVYEGESISPDASAMLTPRTRDQVIQRLNKLVMSNLPQAPAALADGEANLNVMRTRSRFQMFGRYGGPNTGGRLSDNLAGTALIDLIGLGGRLALDLPVKSYIAITEHGPEVESGISYAKEEASFHVIEGQW